MAHRDGTSSHVRVLAHEMGPTNHQIEAPQHLPMTKCGDKVVALSARRVVTRCAERKAELLIVLRGKLCDSQEEQI